MAKQKSKKKDDVKKKDNGVDIFGVDARKVGVAVAGILIGEIVEAAVQRLGEKQVGLDDSDSKDDSGNGHSNPLKNAASQVGEQVEEVGSSAKDTADAIRASAGNVTLNLSDVVDVLRDAGQRLKEKSADTISSSSGNVVENVSSGATAVLDRVLPDTKKSKKGKKKKH